MHFVHRYFIANRQWNFFACEILKNVANVTIPKQLFGIQLIFIYSVTFVHTLMRTINYLESRDGNEEMVHAVPVSAG